MKTVMYYIIYCGSAIGSCHYATKLAAGKAARLYTNISGHEWRIRLMVGRIAEE